jgi:protein SCO1/2
MVRAILILVLATAIFATGCDKPSASEGVARTATAQHTNQQIFQVKGIVIEVKPREKSVTIKHEEVPDYMPAMTMPFDVKDTNELAGLEAGDPVSFRLMVTDTEGWIDHIQKTGPKTNTLPTTGPLRRIRDVEPLVEGDLLPEYQFTNQFGKIFSTKDFKGQALAIEFLFTRCPLPNFCPFLANNFGAAQRDLLALPNAPTNWHLLTISFDPEFDTPAVLKSYADSHGCDPKHWTFATGAQIDITAIGEQFGLLVARDENGSFSHNLRAVVIDSAGRVRKVFIGNEWKPEELVTEMIKAAAR